MIITETNKRNCLSKKKVKHVFTQFYPKKRFPLEIKSNMEMLFSSGFFFSTCFHRSKGVQELFVIMLVSNPYCGKTYSPPVLRL